MSSTYRSIALAVTLVSCLVGVASAQTTATSTETKKFEVIAVDGSQLVVRLPEGTREITVPAGFLFTVDGKQLSVQQLKPGMAGTATITTTTKVTPVTVTSIKNGTVANVTGSNIFVRTDEGVRLFTQGELDKRGVKIYRNGQAANVSDFRTGDRLSAEIVTSMPPKVVTEQEVNATLAASGAPAAARAPAAASASRSAGASGASASAAPAGGGTSGRTLPKTASPLPLLGLLGGLSLFAGVGLTLRRRLTRR